MRKGSFTAFLSGNSGIGITASARQRAKSNSFAMKQSRSKTVRKLSTTSKASKVSKGSKISRASKTSKVSVVSMGTRSRNISRNHCSSQHSEEASVGGYTMLDEKTGANFEYSLEQGSSVRSEQLQDNVPPTSQKVLQTRNLGTNLTRKSNRSNAGPNSWISRTMRRPKGSHNMRTSRKKGTKQAPRKTQRSDSEATQSSAQNRRFGSFRLSTKSKGPIEAVQKSRTLKGSFRSMRDFVSVSNLNASMRMSAKKKPNTEGEIHIESIETIEEEEDPINQSIAFFEDYNETENYRANFLESSRHTGIGSSRPLAGQAPKPSVQRQGSMNSVSSRKQHTDPATGFTELKVDIRKKRRKPASMRATESYLEEEEEDPMEKYNLHTPVSNIRNLESISSDIFCHDQRSSRERNPFDDPLQVASSRPSQNFEESYERRAENEAIDEALNAFAADRMRKRGIGSKFKDKTKHISKKVSNVRSTATNTDYIPSQETAESHLSRHPSNATNSLTPMKELSKIVRSGSAASKVNNAGDVTISDTQVVTDELQELNV